MRSTTVVLKDPFQSARSLLWSLHAAMVPLSFVLFVTGMCSLDFNVMLAGVVALFLSNVIYGFLDLRSRLLFLFIHGGIALFLLSRPVIGALNPERTWLLSTNDTTTFALSALYLTMLCLFLGMVACGAISSWNEKFAARKKTLAPKLVASVEQLRGASAYGLPDANDDGDANDARTFKAKAHTAVEAVGSLSREDKLRYIRLASLLCFIVCVAGSYYDGVIKLSYMEGLSYEDYYLISSSDHVPWAVSTLKTMTPYMLCAYLAAMPKKMPSVVCMGMYIASTLPMLIIGSRGDFVIAFLFAALYFVFRSVIDDEEKWITKEVVVAAAVLIPVGVFAMGMWTYIRADEASNLTSVFAVFEDAFYKQGVSFSVLGYGYDVNPQVQELGFKFFTACAFIENIAEGFIGTTFFGVEPLGSTNSVELALQGRSYSHTMSFFAHSNYLGGEGYGSSYILEWYADFGYAGIAVGSIILAAGMYLLSRSIGRSWFWGTSALISSMAIFHMPRGAATEWISFLITTRFWLAMFLIVVASVVLLFVSRMGERPRSFDLGEADVLVGVESAPELVWSRKQKLGLVTRKADKVCLAPNRHGILTISK